MAKSHHHNTKKQTRLNTPRRRPYTPTGLGGGSLSGLLPDVRIRRTWMPVGRTSPSTRHGEMTERRADVPLSDGDSDRDIVHSRSDWLSSRSRRQRRYVSHAGRRSRFRFRFVPRSALTPAVAYDGDLVVSRRTLAPVSSGETTQHPAFSATALWNRSPSSSSSYTVSQTWCYQSAPTVEPILSSHCTSARLFTTLPLTATHTCVHKHELQLTDFHSRNFFASYSNACISRAQSADRHTVDLTAPHVTMHSCPHVASENNNETGRYT